MLRSYYASFTAVHRTTTYVVGDSIAYGTMSGSTPGTDGPSWADINGYTKLAVPGSMFGTTASTAPEIFNQFNSVPNNANTVILSGGVNNLGKHRDSWTIAARFAWAERVLRRKGVSNVFVMTITPFATSVTGATPTDLAGFNLHRKEVNQWIREIYGVRGQCIDATASVGGDTLVSPYGYVDGVHLTASGQTAYAASVASIIATLAP